MLSALVCMDCVTQVSKNKVVAGQDWKLNYLWQNACISTYVVSRSQTHFFFLCGDVATRD